MEGIENRRSTLLLAVKYEFSVIIPKANNNQQFGSLITKISHQKRCWQRVQKTFITPSFRMNGPVAVIPLEDRQTVTALTIVSIRLLRDERHSVVINREIVIIYYSCKSALSIDNDNDLC